MSPVMRTFAEGIHPVHSEVLRDAASPVERPFANPGWRASSARTRVDAADVTRVLAARTGSLVALGVAAVIACALPRTAFAQDEGGLYIAGYGFSFERAAEQGLARNPPGQRFFVLALSPNTAALTKVATKSAAAVRKRVAASGGVLLVCQRDIDNGSIDAATLVPGVVAVRGFPPRGSDAIPPGERYFPGENPDNLPRNNETLRRLRSTCS